MTELFDALADDDDDIKADALVQIAQASSPSAILVTSSSEGKEIAARAAVRTPPASGSRAARAPVSSTELIIPSCAGH
jgi:electron transfer flavoprotein alpha subunit